MENESIKAWVDVDQVQQLAAGLMGASETGDVPVPHEEQFEGFDSPDEPVSVPPEIGKTLALARQTAEKGGLIDLAEQTSRGEKTKKSTLQSRAALRASTLGAVKTNPAALAAFEPQGLFLQRIKQFAEWMKSGTSGWGAFLSSLDGEILYDELSDSQLGMVTGTLGVRRGL